MRTDQIRALDNEQLAKELENARRELLNLRIRASTRQLANTTTVGNARRKVARILTIMRQRQLVGEQP